MNKKISGEEAKLNGENWEKILSIYILLNENYDYFISKIIGDLTNIQNNELIIFEMKFQKNNKIYNNQLSMFEKSLNDQIKEIDESFKIKKIYIVSNSKINETNNTNLLQYINTDIEEFLINKSTFNLLKSTNLLKNVKYIDTNYMYYIINNVGALLDENFKFNKDFYNKYNNINLSIKNINDSFSLRKNVENIVLFNQSALNKDEQEILEIILMNIDDLSRIKFYCSNSSDFWNDLDSATKNEIIDKIKLLSNNLINIPNKKNVEENIINIIEQIKSK